MSLFDFIIVGFLVVAFSGFYAFGIFIIIKYWKMRIKESDK